MDDADGRFDARLFTLIVLVGCATFAIAVGIGAALDVEPGSLAEWVAGVATFAALLAATYAAVQTAGMLRLEQKRDRERDRLDRQRQAELVAVWSGMMSWLGPAETRTFSAGHVIDSVEPGPPRLVKLPVTIRNASAMPIYNLTVDVYLGDPAIEEPELAARRRVLDVANGRAVVEGTRAIDVVYPPFAAAMYAALERRAAQEAPPITIGWTFRDNAGRWWRQAPGKPLTQVPKPTETDPLIVGPDKPIPDGDYA